MSAAGSIVFQILPVIFAIGVAIGLSRSDKRYCRFSCAARFLNYERNYEWLINYHWHIGKRSACTKWTRHGAAVQTVETGVFGGIITGIMTAILHNKYHKAVLPPYLGFFGGSRFVPIVTAFAASFRCIDVFHLAKHTSRHLSCWWICNEKQCYWYFCLWLHLKIVRSTRFTPYFLLTVLADGTWWYFRKSRALSSRYAEHLLCSTW